MLKEYNVHRHYESRHKAKYGCLQGQVRTDKIAKLKNGLASQQNTFVKMSQLNKSYVRASFLVSKLIASTGRPFSEGEFVKQCLITVAGELIPEKVDAFNSVSLSASTITRTIEEMADNVHSQLQKQSKQFVYFSLALDESTDVQDTAQLLVFIRGVTPTNGDNFEISEELAALQSLKGTTRGEDIFVKVSQTMTDLELDWSKLVNITTDGAPSMTGATRGLVGHINREMDERGHTRPFTVHCLIHQQSLCGKVLKMDSVMKVVVSCVTFIRAKALNHPQFQDFLSDLDAAYGDVLYHTEIRWLSRGKVLERFYNLLPEINEFLLTKGKVVPELIDPEWKWHLAFLTDITQLMNSLNLQLQGEGKLICDMFSHVKAFEVKLGLLQRQIKEENFVHLPMTQKLFAEKPVVAFPVEKCAEVLELLQLEFTARFQEVHLHAKDIRLFQNPFATDIDEVESVYQLELAELQSCDALKDTFLTCKLAHFYASLPKENFPNLKTHALKMLTVFGSTYICEQTFSRMKQLKSPTRSRLTDEHLHQLLRLTTTKMEPDIDLLVSQMQAHQSH